MYVVYDLDITANDMAFCYITQTGYDNSLLDTTLIWFTWNTHISIAFIIDKYYGIHTHAPIIKFLDDIVI